MNMEVLTELRHEREAYKGWKQEQGTQEDYRGTIPAPSPLPEEGVWKAKAQIKRNLARVVKGNKKSFSRRIMSNRKTREK